MRINFPAQAACVVGLALATGTSAQCPPDELAKTTDPTAGDESFGRSVDFDGSLMIVGASGANTNLGASYLFRKDVDPQGVVTWINEQQVVASDPVANDQFGYSVSISGQTAVAGVPQFSSNRPEGGAAFVFIRQPDGLGGFQWVQQQKLVPADGAAGFFFGIDVSIQGDRIAVGASRATASGVGGTPGAVYIFERTGTVWTQTEKIVASFAVSGGLFGGAIDLKGDRLAVGAIGESVFVPPFTSVSGAGAAYVFDRVSDGLGGFIWQEQARLVAPTPLQFARLGADVAIDGDVVVAGAHFETVGGSSGIGAIYIFERDIGGAWPFTARFDPLDFANQGEVFSFGRALGMDAGNLVVGAEASAVFGTANGAAVLFQRPAATWQHQDTFRGSDTNLGTVHLFGQGVSIVAGEAMISSRGPSISGQPVLGAAYHFKLNPVTLAISQHPATTLTQPGSPAALNVVVSGELPLTFEWSRDGVVLVDGPNVSGATTDTLSFASVGVGDIGAYDCTVTNSCGTLLSNPAAISFTAGGSCAGDANGSGDVTFADITEVLANWLNVCP